MLFRYISKSLQKLILAFILATLLFALNTLRLEVLTTSDLQHLDNDDQGGRAYSVWGDGNFVYLANYDNGLEVYTVDQNGQLTHVDNDDQGGYARGVWGDGNFVYLANWTNGLEVYTVDQNGQLTHVDNDNQGGYSRRVWGDGDFVYLANYHNGLEVYSVDQNGQLTHVDNDDQGGNALGIWGDDKYIYLANDINGLEVYSVDQNSQLIHVDNDDQGGYAISIWGDGDFVYLANYHNGLEVYSVDQNGQLTHVDNDDQGGNALGIWGDDKYIYLANRTNGLEVYTVDQNGQLTHVDNDDQGETAVGIWGDEDFVYLANGNNGIEVYSQNALPDNASQMSLNVNSGGLYVDSPETSNFNSVTISKDPESAVASIAGITVEDLRGSLVGWNLNLSINNLSLVDESNNPSPEVDKNILMGDTVDTTVDGNYEGTQFVTITTSGLTTVSGRDHTNSLNLQANPIFDTLSSLDNTGQTGNMLILNAPSQEGAGKYTFDMSFAVDIPAYGNYNIQGENKTVIGGNYQGELVFDLV